jgi:hypothetical protein
MVDAIGLIFLAPKYEFSNMHQHQRIIAIICPVIRIVFSRQAELLFLGNMRVSANYDFVRIAEVTDELRDIDVVSFEDIAGIGILRIEFSNKARYERVEYFGCFFPWPAMAHA